VETLWRRAASIPAGLPGDVTAGEVQLVSTPPTVLLFVPPSTGEWSPTTHLKDPLA